MAENPEQQLSALDENALTPIVRMATEDDSAEIVTWSFRRISGEALNPISAGVYRFWGNALSHGSLKPWAAILKIAQWVDLTRAALEKGYSSTV